MINYSIPSKYVLQCRNENVADFIAPGDKTLSADWSEDGKFLMVTMNFPTGKSATFTVPAQEVDYVNIPVK